MHLSTLCNMLALDCNASCGTYTWYKYFLRDWYFLCLSSTLCILRRLNTTFASDISVVSNSLSYKHLCIECFDFRVCGTTLRIPHSSPPWHHVRAGTARHRVAWKTSSGYQATRGSAWDSRKRCVRYPYIGRPGSRGHEINASSLVYWGIYEVKKNHDIWVFQGFSSVSVSSNEYHISREVA